MSCSHSPCDAGLAVEAGSSRRGDATWQDPAWLLCDSRYGPVVDPGG